MLPGESSTSSDYSCSSASIPTVSADNVSLYMQLHHHPQRHVSSYSESSHDLAACNSDMTMAVCSSAMTMSSRTTNQSFQAAISAAGYSDREGAQLLVMQDRGNAPLALQLQGLSMNYMQAQSYNEQILRSITGSYCAGIEPSSVSEGQERLKVKSDEVLQKRTLENLGRSVSSKQLDVLSGDRQTAPARYEQTCTPRPRWSPTQEQIEILEALFNSGTRTPSRDMIADIAAQLRNYGTIEEANVFYWFQNRKARAKRKQLQPASRSAASSQV